VTANVVRDVAPGAGPWRIAELRADVDNVGRIKIRGAAGPEATASGQNANHSPFATLIGDASALLCRAQRRRNRGVPLEANGDFRIDDTLGSIPSEPGASHPQHYGGFAAGIPKLADE
jgi:hypothetical protein